MCYVGSETSAGAREGRAPQRRDQAVARSANMVEHYAAVRNFVRRLVRDETLAEDLTQEAFVRAEKSSAVHRGDATLRSWLCAIALNTVRDNARATARRPLAVGDVEMLERLPADEDVEGALLAAEMSECIDGYLAEVPSPYYDVVVLHDVAELPHGDIAAILELSVANSRVLLHRGRAMLRQKLRDNCKLSFDGDSVPCERKR